MNGPYNPPLGELSSYVDEQLHRISARDAYAEVISAVLAGSAATGAHDAYSDWDLHLFLPDADYETFRARYGADFVIDDKEHAPPVFGVFRPLGWLGERMLARPEFYLWIFEGATVIRDPERRYGSILEEGRGRFDAGIEQLVRGHYVGYRAARNSLPNTLRRGDPAAALLVVAEAAELALQTTSLLMGQPYPYAKWLLWHLAACGSEGRVVAELTSGLLTAEPGEQMLSADRRLRGEVVRLAGERYPAAPWLGPWWKYLAN